MCSTAGHLANSLQVGLIALGVVDSYPTTIPAGSTPSGGNLLENGESKKEGTSLPSTPSTQNLTQSANLSSSSQVTTLTASNNTNKTRKISRPNGLYESLKLGLIGVVLDPILGFREDGVRGLIVGTAKGSVGLLARPLYGALGFTSVILEKISFNLLPRFLAHQKLRLVRTRPPRFLVSANMPLQVYSADENIGQELLSRVQQGAYRHEGYMWHGHLHENRQLLLTKVRVLLLEDHLEFTEVLWQCSMKNLMSIEVDYSDSVTRSQQDEIKRNLETALRMMATDKTMDSSSNNSHQSTTFRSLLQGEPVLHFYHMPHSDGSSRLVQWILNVKKIS